jgi:hypothetical protein
MAILVRRVNYAENKLVESTQQADSKMTNALGQCFAWQYESISLRCVGVDCSIVILPKSTTSVSSSANLKIILKLPKKVKLSGPISPCRKSSRFSDTNSGPPNLAICGGLLPTFFGGYAAFQQAFKFC